MRTITDANARSTMLRRLAWFGGLWLVGVAAVGLVAGILRWVIHAL